MPQPLTVQLNGHPRPIETLETPANLDAVIAALELKADRIAIELNGDIVRRAAWPTTSIQTGDRLEIVHFVGGGLA
jgi:sulfur carrier protein